MKKKFLNLSPKMKNLLMAKWIRQYVKRGVSLRDDQPDARGKAVEWTRAERMRKLRAAEEA